MAILSVHLPSSKLGENLSKTGWHHRGERGRSESPTRDRAGGTEMGGERVLCVVDGVWGTAGPEDPPR